FRAVARQAPQDPAGRVVAAVDDAAAPARRRLAGRGFRAVCRGQDGQPLALVAATRRDAHARGRRRRSSGVAGGARARRPAGRKSTMLRELCIWRLLQADRFGEAQVIVHVAKDRAIAAEVQRAARAWARERPDEFPRTMSANGYEVIEHASGGRWLIKSRAGSDGHSG